MSSLAAIAVGALLGAVVGSFVTTAALRATRAEQAITGRSRCDHCQHPLSFAATIPILSYAQAKGRCGACRARVDVTHPIGELAGCLIGAMTALLSPGWEMLLIALLAYTLLAAAVYDAKTRRLPNGLTLVVAVVCAALSLRASAASLYVGLASAAAAWLILMGLRRMRLGRRDPGLGYGDVKLICALALWLGLQTSAMLAMAAILGLVAVAVLRPADRRISFGPAIALASFVMTIALEVGWWPAAF